jgi:hypothetical protein
MNKSVFIGTPAYDGRVHVQYALMLLDLDQMFREMGYHVIIRIPTMGSLLVANRNRLLQLFVDSGAQWMLCIDSDLSAEINIVPEIIKDNLDFFAGVYPMRDNKTFIFRPETEPNGKIKMDKTEKYLKMKNTPAGFMMFQRHVIEDMQKKFPELKYQPKEPQFANENAYAFFNTELHDGEFWGEDYMFCKRVRETGYDILTNPYVKFNHAGAQGALIETLTNDPSKAQGNINTS